MNVFKEQKNRGYVIAGIGGVIGLIAFFLPYYTVSYTTGVYSTIGTSYSINGAGFGSWLWIAELATLLVIGIAAVLTFRNNAFGLTNIPLAKQVLYGKIAIISAAGLALLLHIIFAISAQSLSYNTFSFFSANISGGLSFGFFLNVLAVIAMGVGGILALRTPTVAAGVEGYQQPYQQSQYSPYQQPYQQQYPTADQQPQYGQYPTADQQPQYGQYPPQQGYQQPNAPTGMAQQPQYPPQQGYQQPNAPTGMAQQPQYPPQQGYQQPYMPTEMAQQPQYPPQQGYQQPYMPTEMAQQPQYPQTQQPQYPPPQQPQYPDPQSQYPPQPQSPQQTGW